MSSPAIKLRFRTTILPRKIYVFHEFFDEIPIFIFVGDLSNHPSDIRPIVIFSGSLAHNL